MADKVETEGISGTVIGGIKWVLIIVGILWGISRIDMVDANGAAKEKVNKALDAATFQIATSVATTASGHIGIQVVERILIPGADPISFVLDGTKNLDWTPRTGDYCIRYIKMDGMPWYAPRASPNGWLWGDEDYSGAEVRKMAGRIAKVQFGVPLSRPVKVGENEYREDPCHAVTLRVAIDPTLTRYE